MRNQSILTRLFTLGLCSFLAASVTANESVDLKEKKSSSDEQVARRETKPDYSYKAAFQRAQKANQPLVVIVTATWCAPCQVMKNQTIKQVMAKDGFEDVILAFVDVDQEPALAKNLTKGQGIPHVVVFEKKQTKWKRRTLFGVQTAETLQAFIKPRFQKSVDQDIQRVADGNAEVVNRK